MIIGKLNKRISIQQLTEGQDEIGNQVKTWVDFYSCFAYANGLSGTEYFAAAATQAENTVTFEIRYNVSLKDIDTTTYRIVFDGKIYDIENIDNIQFKNETLKLKAVAKNV